MSFVKVVLVTVGTTLVVVVSELCFSCVSCGGASDVTISSSVAAVAAFAFYECEGLRSVSVRSIGTYAFAGSADLRVVTIIGAGLESIGFRRS